MRRIDSQPSSIHTVSQVATEVPFPRAPPPPTVRHGPVVALRIEGEVKSVNENAVALRFTDRAAAYQSLSDLTYLSAVTTRSVPPS